MGTSHSALSLPEVAPVPGARAGTFRVTVGAVGRLGSHSGVPVAATQRAASGPGPLLAPQPCPEPLPQAFPRAEVQACPRHAGCPAACAGVKGPGGRVLPLCALRCRKQAAPFSFHLSQPISSFLPHPPAERTPAASCPPASLTFAMWSLLGKPARASGLIATFLQGHVCPVSV